jgi:hypothetical protein
MHSRLPVLALVLSFSLAGAAKKAPPSGRGESESIVVTATALLEKEAIQERLGSDLDGHYVVVDVRVASRFGKEIDVRRGDFLLRTDKDGEKSEPFAPSQIAGRGALVISQTGRGGGAIMGDSGGPVWGGYPGSTDRPRRMGGDGGAIGGGMGGTEAQARVNSGAGEKANPLKQVLEEKILPEKKTTEELTGLLYFPLGKQKAKDLELVYKAADGKIAVRFK